MEIIKLRDEYIKLGQALKAAGLVGSGVEAKIVIQDGEVTVNGQTELQRVRSFMTGILWNLKGIRLKLRDN